MSQMRQLWDFAHAKDGSWVPVATAKGSQWWRIKLRGWEPYLVEAANRSKAKARAYRHYCDGWTWVTFMAFCRMVESVTHEPRKSLDL